MDLDQLSTSQLILLTLLVSFVTSMATGIVTVSLMQETPITVGDTVSRVIERTIHEVISPATSSPTVVVQTPPASDSSSIAGVVQKTMPSVVRIFMNEGTNTFAGAGIVVAPGVILTDSAALSGTTAANISIAGKNIALNVVSEDTVSGITILNATSTGTTSISWIPSAITRNTHAVGEPVYTIFGGKSPKLARGVITSITPGRDIAPTIVDTDIAGLNDDVIGVGVPLYSQNGTLIGMRTHVSTMLAETSFILFNTQIPPPTMKVSGTNKSN
ncbi:MAG: hypothetical protein JWO50_553 [Candidatus Kaiserbacteria bacterium]|nr:hypothetical protein [Candidatus Kaiserbacteria bacterium]